MPQRIPSLFRMLKRRAPTSLFGRSLLIIVLPIAVMQILVTWFFFDSYWQRVNSHLTEGLAGEVAVGRAGLMGWPGSRDTRSQVRMHFETKEAAIAFAQKNGYTYEIHDDEPPAPPAPKAYADNFRFDRVE